MMMMMMNSYIHTDKKVGHNRSDIIIHDDDLKECQIIHVAIPL